VTQRLAETSAQADSVVPLGWDPDWAADSVREMVAAREFPGESPSRRLALVRLAAVLRAQLSLALGDLALDQGDPVDLVEADRHSFLEVRAVVAGAEVAVPEGEAAVQVAEAQLRDAAGCNNYSDWHALRSSARIEFDSI
jgi:hypothetical protein